MRNGTSNRRRFFHKIVRVGAIGGIASLLLGRLGEKTLITPVQAAGNMAIDAVNIGYGTTQLRSGYGYGPAFYGYATSSWGTTKGVYGLSASPSGIGVGGWALASTGFTTGVLGVSDSSSGISVLGQAGVAGATPIVANGISGQTANLQEWRKNNTALSVIDKDGKLGIGTSSPARSTHLVGNSACFRMDRDADSSAFILVRTAPGNFSTIWKSFYVGVNASGVNNGEFFIGDAGTNVSGASAVRLWIDNSGTVHIPSLGSGDINFANGIKATEEGEGLVFLNAKGNKIAILDSEGNLRIKGDVIKDPTL